MQLHFADFFNLSAQELSSEALTEIVPFQISNDSDEEKTEIGNTLAKCKKKPCNCGKFNMQELAQGKKNKRKKLIDGDILSCKKCGNPNKKHIA